MSLSQYLKRFSRLRTDKHHKRWSALTTYHEGGVVWKKMIKFISNYKNT